MKPFVVEKRQSQHRVGIASPSRRPETRIRSWHADEVKREEGVKPFPSQEHRDAFGEAFQKVRSINDPESQRQIGQQIIGHDMTQHAMSHYQIIEDPRDPRIVVRPKQKMFRYLKQSFALQYGEAGKVVTNPRGPRGTGFAAFWRKFRGEG